MLRSHAELVGLKPNFSILDTDDQLRLLKQIINAANIAAKLGLAIEPVSTQVIPRDRHAMFFAVLGVIASSIERLSVEVRHLQRTEVLEAEEYFSPGQKGSSAMPHKRNPILTETLTGLPPMVRSATIPAMTNVAPWPERASNHHPYKPIT